MSPLIQGHTSFCLNKCRERDRYIYRGREKEIIVRVLNRQISKDLQKISRENERSRKNTFAIDIDGL